MSNLREVKNDILQEWMLFRDEEISTLSYPEDKKHFINLDEIREKILSNVPKNKKYFVNKQLEILDNNFIDYISYWNEKYYRNGFCDGVEFFLLNKKIQLCYKTLYFVHNCNFL